MTSICNSKRPDARYDGGRSVPAETVLEAAALEVVLELLLNIPRRDGALRREVGLERGIIFLEILLDSLFEGSAQYLHLSFFAQSQLFQGQLT